MTAEPVELFYKEYGEGPPLVILHGLLGAGGNWHTLSRGVFGETHTVYTVDLRNHGRSPHAEPFDYPAMVADMEAFFEARGLDEAVVLGHSMGGKVAMHFALAHPERVSKLIVVDIAPRSYPPSHEPIFQALKSVDFSRVNAREDVDAQLADRVPSKPVRQFLMKNLSYEDGSYAWQMALETIHRQYARINEPVESDRVYDGPTLVVRGEKSDYVQDEDMGLIRGFFPQARLATVKNAGHWVHADAPDAFADVVVAFLQG